MYWAAGGGEEMHVIADRKVSGPWSAERALAADLALARMVAPPPFSGDKLRGTPGRPVIYEPGSLVKNFFTWRGTTFPVLLRRPDYIFFVALGVGVTYRYQVQCRRAA